MINSFFLQLGDYSVDNPPGFVFSGETIGSVVSVLVDKWIFPLAGLLLLAYLVFAGFDLMTSQGDPKTLEEAKQKVTGAIVGFLIVFAAFWIYQIVKYILGISTT